MKNLALVLTITVTFLCGMYFYGTAHREQSNYLNLQPVELHRVLCIDDWGAAVTYHIPIPSLEGFTTEDEHDLEEAFAQGFCDNLN